MYKKERKFSIPYSNKILATDYLDLISNYKNNIENIYLGIPELANHVSLQNKKSKNYDNEPYVYNF